MNKALLRYEFENRNQGGSVGFKDFDASIAHERRRGLARTFYVGAPIVVVIGIGVGVKGILTLPELPACSPPLEPIKWSYMTTSVKPMAKISLKDAKAGFSTLVDGALKGEFVTITRHGKPVAALVSVEAAEIARKAMGKRRVGLAAYLRTFPGGDFERYRTPSRDVEL